MVKSLKERMEGISQKTRNTLSMDEWVVALFSVYRDVDVNRSGAELWLQVLDEASKLMEAIRKEEIPDVLKQCVKVFGWTASFVGKYTLEVPTDTTDPIGEALSKPSSGDFIEAEESLTKFVLEKYPESCSVCREKMCHCTTYRPITENRKDARYENEFNALLADRETKYAEAKKRLGDVAYRDKLLQRPIDETFLMFNTIYGGVIYDLDLWKIGDHLMEEIGEVAKRVVDLTQLKRLEILSAAEIRSAVTEAADKTLSRFQDLRPGTVQDISTMKDSELIAYFRSHQVYGLKTEIADVISWLSGIWNKTSLRLGKSQSFAQNLIDHYSNYHGLLACKACQRTTCSEQCLSIDVCSRSILEKRRVN